MATREPSRTRVINFLRLGFPSAPGAAAWTNAAVDVVPVQSPWRADERIALSGVAVRLSNCKPAGT
ncbi:MAG: hypothetical protein CL931_05005 [Deltaproteobacteria bacterium]|nr:hypothetical protein [Deltaproteobacteria bacterium]